MHSWLILRDARESALLRMTVVMWRDHRKMELSPAVMFVSVTTGRHLMARKYSKGAAAKVKRAMKKRKAGTLKSGRSGKKVKSRKQAIAIGLSEARKEGKKVPKKKTAKKSKLKSSKR
jgi:hypothetical protein